MPGAAIVTAKTMNPSPPVYNGRPSHFRRPASSKIKSTDSALPPAFSHWFWRFADLRSNFALDFGSCGCFFHFWSIVRRSFSCRRRLHCIITPIGASSRGSRRLLFGCVYNLCGRFSAWHGRSLIGLIRGRAGRLIGVNDSFFRFGIHFLFVATVATTPATTAPTTARRCIRCSA